MKTVNIKIYSFSELNEAAKQKAIYEHIDFLDSVPEDYENEAGEMESEYVDHTEAEAIESIEANDYFFYADGDLAHCVTYCGNHPEAGKTELKFHGEIYSI